MQRLKVLLFSPFGCGEQYNGLATFSHRLYARDPNRFEITLVHGRRIQEPTPVIAESVYLREFEPGLLALYRWVRDSKKWLRENASRFDVMFGLLGFHCTMVPAHYADTQLGLPAAVLIANESLDLGGKGGLKDILRLPQKRQKMATEISKVVGMSREIRDELRSYGVAEDRIADIPMGADLTRFKPPSAEEKARLRKEFNLGSSKVIAFSGLVCPRKQPDFLIEAIGRSQKEGHDWQLLIAGPEGEQVYIQKLRQRAEELGVVDRVHWIGFTYEIERVYAAADVYSLPSTNEGMPASVIEAMATGLPVVITDFSSCHDVVPTEREGVVVKQTDVDALYKGLEAFLENPERLRVGSKAAQEHSAKNFDAEIVLDRYEEMFHSISSRSRN